MPIQPANPIFISYSRRDDAIMRKIAFHLRDQGYKVWVDNEKLIPGTAAWEESIENAIKNAFAVIVILSPDSKGSEWVRREITYADQFQKRVFPVLVKGSEEISLPLRLVTRQYVDLREDENAGLSALSAAIQFFIDEKQTLEMKRPMLKQEEKSASSETPSPHTRPKKAGPSVKWILPAGIFLAICIVGLGVIWAGYQLYPRSTPVASTETAEPNFPAIAPTETVADTPAATTIKPVNPDIPAPDILSRYLNDVQVTSIDTFDGQGGENWGVSAGEIKDGVLEITGNESLDGAWRKREFEEGEGILVDFDFTERSTFLVYLNFGSYGTDPFRRFGMYVENGTPITDIYSGAEYIWGGFSGDLAVEAGKTHTILLAILPDGEILEVLWDPSDPAKILEYRNAFGETWAGLPWTFVIQAQKGMIRFDNFEEIKFSGTK
jgi:hypothetical protein